MKSSNNQLTGDFTLSLLLFFIVSFLASVVGAISGIGGGILIKPALEAVSDYSVEVISFLSGCTVLSMAVVSLLKRRKSAAEFEFRRGTLLAVGSALGGVAGKLIFDILDGQSLGLWQSLLLCLMILVLLLYLKVKSWLPKVELKSNGICLLLGAVLGLLSAFMGIGGGPMNLAVLTYFLRMDNKKASLHSIYVILFSQTASLILSFACGKIPACPLPLLICMIIGGVLGGLTGSRLGSALSNKAIGRLYALILGFVLLLSGRNLLSYI